MKAGCDHFMHSDLVPAWGCRCCKSTSGLKKHSYWNVYSRSNDNNEGAAVPEEKPAPKEKKKNSRKKDKYNFVKRKMVC